MVAPGDYLEFYPGLNFKKQIRGQKAVFEAFQTAYAARPGAARKMAGGLMIFELNTGGPSLKVYFFRSVNRIFVLAVADACRAPDDAWIQEMVGMARRFSKGDGR